MSSQDAIKEDVAEVPEGTRGVVETLTPQEEAALIEAAKQTLPVAFVENGPPLGLEFDPVPCGKRFGMDEAGKPKRMVIGDYDAQAAADGSIQEIRKRQDWAPGQKRKTFIPRPFESGVHMDLSPSQYMMHMDGGPRTEKELEREQKRRERKLHKEQERIHREQQKELERQQREHEKKLKAQQKEEEKQKLQLERDMKKLERDMERERKAEERKRLQETKKREKDLQKAFAAQVKVVQKELQKELAAGPPDDLELEMEELVKAQTTSESLPAERPPFPPPSVEMDLAFPHLGSSIGGDVMMIWGFVQSFSDIIALPPFTINDFIGALRTGQKSTLLSSIHIVLIRLIQADMEESHHVVLTQGSGGTSNFMDRAVVGIAGTLDEAVSWGFDIDAWRAHLNQYTWPEILRQLAIAAGYGAKRSRGMRDRGHRAKEDGEDMALDESRAGYGLKMPSRLTQGTVKAAAWQVLSEVGPEGLTISEIASRIQKQGLRDLRTSKTPEATVAGALSRDAVFCRVAPATYALHAVLPSAENQNPASAVIENGDAASKNEALEEAGDEMETDKFLHGEAWIPLLSNGDYDTLTLEQRLDVLKTLCNMALESPTIRACLDGRLGREIAEQKRIEIEAKAEKRARREQAAEETQRRLMELESAEVGDPRENLDAKVKDLMAETLQMTIPETCIVRNEVPKAQDHIRFEPLGKDRRYNRYWSFKCNGATQDVDGAHGLLFAEVNGVFKVLKSKKELEALIKSLEIKGAREGPLYCALKNYNEELKDTELPLWCEAEYDQQMEQESESSASEEVLLFAKRWGTADATDCPPSPSSHWLEYLKRRLSEIELSVPLSAKSELDSAMWKAQLEEASSIDDILGAMGRLEFHLDSHVFHTNYNKMPQILFGAWSDSFNPETAGQADGLLSWLPRSYAAAFLHLLTLDASLCYHSSSPPGREALLAYKYVQKPFVQELNAHIDISVVPRSLDNVSQTVAVEPVSTGGKLVMSSFPVLQKGQPVQKQPVPFSFEVEGVRQAVRAAENSGTLYANIHLSKARGGKGSTKQEGAGKGSECATTERTHSELEDDMSTSDAAPSSEEERREEVFYHDDDEDEEEEDEEDDNETMDRSELSRDEHDDDYRL